MINDRRMDQNKKSILNFYKVGTEQWMLTIAENHHSHNVTNLVSMWEYWYSSCVFGEYKRFLDCV